MSEHYIETITPYSKNFKFVDSVYLPATFVLSIQRETKMCIKWQYII